MSSTSVSVKFVWLNLDRRTCSIHAPQGKEHCKDRLRDEGQPSHETNSINRLNFFVIKCDNLYGKFECTHIIKTFFSDHSLPTCTCYCQSFRAFDPAVELNSIKVDSNDNLRPCQGEVGGGGLMSPVWILKRLVSVFINACRLLSALPSLSQFGWGRLSLAAISFHALSLLFGPCRLSDFTLAGPHNLFRLIPGKFELWPMSIS